MKKATLRAASLILLFGFFSCFFCRSFFSCFCRSRFLSRFLYRFFLFRTTYASRADMDLSAFASFVTFSHNFKFNI